MSGELQQIIRQEFINCSQDPKHFINKYGFITHPQRGRILFTMYPFQNQVMDLFKENDYTIVLKARQLGISTLVAAYALWLMLFHPNKTVLCIATKQDTARNMVEKVRFMYDNLPSWLKISTNEDNKLSLKFSNGSIIKATSAASDSGRSEAVSLLIIDEGAFISGIENIWASSQQTLATGGQAIILSTPFGVGNWFHKTWVAAQNKENEFLPIKLPWYVHPERDEEWRRRQDELLGDPRIASQELDCDFSTSGDIVFYNEWLEFIKETTIKEPLERRGVDQNLWVWENVDYSREYMITADVARGDGKDFSACHIIDIETNVQVAEYKGQLPPKEFGYFLTGLATEYNNALLVIENAGVGWATIDAVIERNYRNLYYSPKSDKLTADSYLRVYETNTEMVPGFVMSLRSRPLCINKFREFVGDKSVTIRSKRLLEEMRVFVWKNGRAEAQPGYNDDLVMSFAIGMFLRDTSLKFKQESLDRARAALGNISSNNTQYKGIYSNNSIKNPYAIEVGKNKEDIRWLFS